MLSGPQAANLGIRIDKFTTELLKSAKLGDFAFSLVYGGGSGQGFGDALAGNLCS
jgi:hypothetical protein